MENRGTAPNPLNVASMFSLNCLLFLILLMFVFLSLGLFLKGGALSLTHLAPIACPSISPVQRCDIRTCRHAFYPLFYWLKQ